jgi:uncharacterized membrane protein YbaN (DUF454 family)
MKGHTLKKYAFLVLGTLCLGIGMIGVVIPVLPTTPFLLMASFFYLRSSKRMYDWMLNHKVFGTYIYCYTKHRGVSQKAKNGTLIFLWSTLILSMILVSGWQIKIILLLVGIAVSTHIILLKTLGEDEIKLIKQRFQNEIEVI